MSDKRRALASNVQLYVLNKLGRLGDALDEDGRAYRDTCWRMVSEAVERGEWTPKQQRKPEGGNE